MDELLDLADAFDLLSGVSDLDLLDEGSIDALSQILEGADYFSSAPDLLEAFSHLNLEVMDMWNESYTDFFENLSDVEQGEFLSGLDADALEVSTSFSPDFLDAMDAEASSEFFEEYDVATNLNEAFTEIPEPFKENLGDVVWTPKKNIENPNLLGLWDPDTPDGKPSITMFDHAEEAEATLHHEIGHHIAKIQPAFFNQFIEIVAEEPDFWAAEVDHLESYRSHQIADELFAQAIMKYNTEPEILSRKFPVIFTLIDSWWQAAAGAQTA
jgi:hypothetical protein